MATVTFVEHDGNAQTVDIKPGTTLMKGAVANGIAGIEAICGGACACGTCHVFIDETWRTRATPMSLAEAALLRVLKKRQPGSRLSCQITVSARLDGLRVHIPEPS